MRTLACGAIVAAVLVTAVPVAAKEGMTATLLSRVSIGAMPETTMRIAWRIDEKSASAASDDDRFYVRLDSATGARSTHAYGRRTGGHYVARVRVPRGGIRDIRIFLKGWVFYPGGAHHRADMSIPISNDPLP